jgi:hypothetical protein
LPVSVPELVVVELPPAPFACVKMPPVLVPELIVVEFWPAPFAWVKMLALLVPEFVQMTSVEVVVQTTCAVAGALINASVAITAKHSGNDTTRGDNRTTRSDFLLVMQSPKRRETIQDSETVFKK